MKQVQVYVDSLRWGLVPIPATDYPIVADTESDFFNSGTMINASKMDNIHPDMKQYQPLARSIQSMVQGILND